MRSVRTGRAGVVLAANTGNSVVLETLAAVRCTKSVSSTVVGRMAPVVALESWV
jgi:hypothetical protein